MSDEHEGYELEMPFVNVTSVGGEFDDDAYAAGWEMGRLDELLIWSSDALNSADVVIEQTLRTANVAQADLVAMNRGFRIVEREELGEWTHCGFARAVEGTSS